MEMSCTVLTRNEIWGIIAGEIPQAFNPLCCNGKETMMSCIKPPFTTIRSRSALGESETKARKNKIFFFFLI